MALVVGDIGCIDAPLFLTLNAGSRRSPIFFWSGGGQMLQLGFWIGSSVPSILLELALNSAFFNLNFQITFSKLSEQHF